MTELINQYFLFYTLINFFVLQNVQKNKKNIAGIDCIIIYGIYIQLKYLATTHPPVSMAVSIIINTGFELNKVKLYIVLTQNNVNKNHIGPILTFKLLSIVVPNNKFCT